MRGSFSTAVFCRAPGGKELLFGGNGSLQVREPVTREFLAELHDARDIAFSPDGTRAVLCSFFENHLIDTRTWKELRKLPESSEAQYLPDGRHVLMTENRREPPLACYDSRSWKRVPLPAEVPAEAVKYLPTPNGRRAIVELKPETVVLWDSSERRQIAVLGQKSTLCAAAVSPDGSLVAVALRTWTTTARIATFSIWGLEDGALVRELHPFERKVRNVGDGEATLLWSPDGRYVCTGVISDWGSPQPICLFAVASGRSLIEFSGARHLIGAALLPETNELVAGTREGKILAWDFQAALQEVRRFQEALGR